MSAFLFFTLVVLLALLAYFDTRKPDLRRARFLIGGFLLIATILALPPLLNRPLIDINAPLRTIFEPLARAWLQPPIVP